MAIAREELISTRNENEKLHQELIQKRHSEELSHEKLLDCQKEAGLLSAQLLEDKSKDRNEISLLKQKIAGHESESVQLKSKLQKHEKESEDHFNHAESYEKQIAETRKEVDSQRKLVADRDLELNAYKHRVVEAESTHQVLKAQLSAQADVIQEHKQNLENTSQENARLLGELAASRQNAEASDSEKALQWQAVRKAEGLYGQLREQFEQKSQILDQTRYELFHAQEQLSKYLREKKENDIYRISPEENAMLKHIHHTEQYYSQMINALEKEIDGLQSLIDHMMIKQDNAQ